MADREVRSTLVLEANTEGLRRLEDLLKRIAELGGTAASAVGGIGSGAGASGRGQPTSGITTTPPESGAPGSDAGGAGGGGGGPVPPPMPGRQPPPAPGSQEWWRSVMLGGRGVAALGAGGFAGYMMMRSLGQFGSAAGSYMQAGVGEAGGMVSGSPFGAASAMLQAETQRSIAVRQGIGGAAGALGSGIAGIGGVGLASGAAGALSGPVGWGLLAGGALLSVASQFGTSAATAAVGKLNAVEQAAVSRAESIVGRRGALAQTITGAVPFGAVADLDELRQMGDRYGFAATDLSGMNLSYRRAGGRGLGVEHLAQAKLGWQLSPEVLGQYEKPFLPGGGATRGGDALKDLQSVMAAGIASGIDATRMPEYLARTSSLLASAADQGLNIRSESVQQLVADLGAANPALQGMSRLRAAESTIQTGRQLSSTVTNTMAPRELVEGLLMRDVIGQGGGPLDWSRRLNDPEQFGQAASRVVTGAPDMLRPFIASQITGLVPEQANLSGWRAGGGQIPSGKDVLAGAARRVTEDPNFAFQQATAQTANVETLTLTLQELKPILESMRDFMRASVDGAREKATGSIEKAARELRPEPEFNKYGDNYVNGARVTTWRGVRLK